jgi:hypothetical protein
MLSTGAGGEVKFVQPRGPYAEVMARYYAGTLSARQCAQQLLALSGIGGEPVAQYPKTNSHKHATRKTKKDHAGEQLRAFHVWLTDCERVAEATAYRYVMRLKQLEEEGLDLKDGESLVAIVRSGRPFKNLEQCRAATKYWHRFVGGKLLACLAAVVGQFGLIVC